MSAPVERNVRVSTLELFFDLVFVFTITQLTGVLVAGSDAESALRVAVMLAEVNAVRPEALRKPHAVVDDECHTGIGTDAL